MLIYLAHGLSVILEQAKDKVQINPDGFCWEESRLAIRLTNFPF